MQQHAVPQPITSYEFRLVGDMTLKQFGKLSAGVILALIVYAINPPAFLKWFLIFLFSGVGAAMAFVPFGGRSVDAWIVAFLKRIYSPTQYIWRQKEKTISSPPQPQAKTTPAISPLRVPPPKIETNMPNHPPSPLSMASQSATSPFAARTSSVPATSFTLPPLPKTESKTVGAKFTPDVVVPATPSLPNLIVGFVVDKQGKLIEGAILEIRDSQGSPVRAFKTNKLGQFLSATPLHNGTYEIETEREGFEFDIIKIDLEGKILPPIEIVSK